MLTDLFPALAQLSIGTVLLRIALAALCGGLVGLERGRKGRPAGFRTHILVCLGAALAMMTNQYIYESFGASGDPARLGAQVISGIGFLGAGTIIVTGQHQVKGLTTAAGLWASACVGLAVGIGFYEAAVIACVVIALAERVLRDFGSQSSPKERTIVLFLAFRDGAALGETIAYLHSQKIRVEDVETIKAEHPVDPSVTALLTLYSPTPRVAAVLAEQLALRDGVVRAEAV